MGVRSILHLNRRGEFRARILPSYYDRRTDIVLAHNSVLMARLAAYTARAFQTLQVLREGGPTTDPVASYAESLSWLTKPKKKIA